MSMPPGSDCVLQLLSAAQCMHILENVCQHLLRVCISLDDLKNPFFYLMTSTLNCIVLAGQPYPDHNDCEANDLQKCMAMIHICKWVEIPSDDNPRKAINNTRDSSVGYCTKKNSRGLL